MAAPLTTLTGMKALENLMDSEAGIARLATASERTSSCFKIELGHSGYHIISMSSFLKKSVM